MARDVERSHLLLVLEEFADPLERDEAVDATGDVTCLLADGAENFGAIVGRSETETVDSQGELASEVTTMLPRRAVGEPDQSEGEGD